MTSPMQIHRMDAALEAAARAKKLNCEHLMWNTCQKLGCRPRVLFPGQKQAIAGTGFGKQPGEFYKSQDSQAINGDQKYTDSVPSTCIVVSTDR